MDILIIGDASNGTNNLDNTVYNFETNASVGSGSDKVDLTNIAGVTAANLDINLAGDTATFMSNGGTALNTLVFDGVNNLSDNDFLFA